MNRRIKDNRALNQSRRERRKEQREYYKGSGNTNISKKSSSRFSPEQIANAREKIAHQAVQSRRREKIYYAILAVTAIIGLILVLAIMNW